MSKKANIMPWKQVCVLRKEIRERELTTADYAVDLHKVVNGTKGETPFYCDPEQFFATTYATGNLREFCSVVLRRLAKKKGGESIINVAQTFGGGKSHTLSALYYLTTLGNKLPKKERSVSQILNHAQIKAPPTAHVAAVSFDKVDWKRGGEAKAPEGEVRRFRMPWNLIAWQLLGQKGLDIFQRDESQPDYDTPPAEDLWAEILNQVEESGQGALILIDEFLMWAHDAASPDPTGESRDRGPFWFERLKNFFQRLSGAVESSQRSCLVVSLLATDPAKNDQTGREILRACSNALNRQASLQSPVEKDDLAELLRRRLFEKYPQNPEDRKTHILAFWSRMAAVDPIRAKLPDSQGRLINFYPFHPDLIDRLFGKWVDLDQFQRTRGVLQTFAVALRDAEKWDDSPLVGPQILLGAPGSDGLSAALLKLAQVAKDSQREKNPEWPQNMKTELPRALQAQKTDAPTLIGREIEAACVAAFIFSQPIGEQAELSELRWLLAATCDMPAVLNNGLCSWSRTSWYLEECEATEAGTGVPKFWRLGPKPNLTQLHDSYKRQAMKYAKNQFDDLAKTKCAPLYEDPYDTGVLFHKLPEDPNDIDDDGRFRIAILGAEYAGIVGEPPKADAATFLTTHSSPTDVRTYQNIVLIAIPSVPGLQQAEQHIASWQAWQEIKRTDQYRDMDSGQQQIVRKRETDDLKDARTAVKNAYEIVIYLHKDGSVQARKITMGAESLLATLLADKDLRLFREKIEPTALMPAGPSSVWPDTDPSIPVKDLYLAFGQQPQLPKLLSNRTVLNTIEDAVQRGLFALRCVRSDGSEQWYWKSPIEMANWGLVAEAWLPQEATINSLNPSAILPLSLKGLWPEDGTGVKLSMLCSWFDGTHCFEEQTVPDYPPELQPIPKADYKVVHEAVARAVENGNLWLVYGNESIFRKKPTEVQLDPEAALFSPPEPLSGIDFLPERLPEGTWIEAEEPETTVSKLYAAIKKTRGRPWPEQLFLDGLNSAIGQGFMIRATDAGPISSLAREGNVKFVIKADVPPPPPPLPTGRRRTSTASLSVSEIQTLAEEIGQIAKQLAGEDLQTEVTLSVKEENGKDLKQINALLEKIKRDWKF